MDDFKTAKSPGYLTFSSILASNRHLAYSSPTLLISPSGSLIRLSIRFIPVTRAL